MSPGKKIVDVLPSEYSEFFDYCRNSGKEYIGEITFADYIAFRSQYGLERQFVEEIRKIIESELGEQKDDHEDYPYSNVSLEEDDDEYEVVEPAKSDTRTRVKPPLPVEEDSEVPLYMLFNVTWEKYENKPVTEIDFGVRVYNILNRMNFKGGIYSSCNKIGGLLKLTTAQLRRFSGMGKESINVIFEGLSKILPEEKPATKKDFEKFKSKVIAMLTGNDYDLSDLYETQVQIFNLFKDAADSIGYEMALAAIEKDFNINVVKGMLSDFSKETYEHFALKERLLERVFCIPEKILDLPVKPFISVYNSFATADKKLLDYFPENLSSVKEYFYIGLYDRDPLEVEFKLIPFADWLNYDYKTLRENMLEKSGGLLPRHRDILIRRSLGATLEEIASEYGLSRERIRQIEKKAIIKILRLKGKYFSGHNSFSMLYALNGGKAYIGYGDILMLMGQPDAAILWYLTKTKKLFDKNYEYVEGLDKVVWIAHENEIDYQDLLLNDFPPIFEKKELPDLIRKNVEEHGADEGLLSLYVEKLYKTSGIFYHRQRITVDFICSYILKTRFINGYKIADEDTQKMFAQYNMELFGPWRTLTPRAVDAKMSGLGVLIDRGKYIHPTYIDFDRTILEKIYDYFKNSWRQAISYSELFLIFKKDLMHTQVNNRYALQGVMKFFECPYLTAKDYISKYPEAKPENDFEKFVIENGPIHISEILKEFKGLTELNIGFYVQRLSDVLVMSGGFYAHASIFDIIEDDYDEQREFLLNMCSEKPVSSRILFNEYLSIFPGFIHRNNIESHGQLFGLLKYMFDGEFYFSRPYISYNREHNLTHRGAIMHLLEGIDSIEIDDLKDLCDDNAIKYVSVRKLIELIEPEYIRVGQTSVMRTELTGIDDDIIADVAQDIGYILKGSRGFLAARNFDSYSWLPRLNVPWNVFLLESVVRLSDGLVKSLQINTSDVGVPAMIFIGEEYEDEDLESLIIKVLKKEDTAVPFTSKEELLLWLQEQGLCNVNLPAFLENEGYIYYDEEGRFRVL